MNAKIEKARSEHEALDRHIEALQEVELKCKPYWQKNPKLTVGEALALYQQDLENDAFEEGYEQGKTDGFFEGLDAKPAPGAKGDNQ